jgi:hypothetical protein
MAASFGLSPPFTAAVSPRGKCLADAILFAQTRYSIRLKNPEMSQRLVTRLRFRQSVWLNHGVFL